MINIAFFLLIWQLIKNSSVVECHPIMSLDVNLSEPDEFNCLELHTSLKEVAKIKGVNKFSYHVECICGKGENYIANIFRATIIDSENENNTVSVIVKTLINTERKELFHDLHKREVAVYDNILPKYVEFQQLLEVKHRVVFAECIYSVVENSKEVLVLEDMREKGYETDKKLANYDRLDYAQVSTALKELAKFHSLSIIYEKHEPESFAKLKTEFRDIIFCESFLNKTKLRNYFHESFGMSLGLVGNCGARSKLESVRENLLEILRLFTEPVQCGVLCHGDFWMNNIMFKVQEVGTPQACIVDFQTMRYASPATDIFHFLYLCTDSSFRKEHLNSLLKEYYDTLKWSLKVHDIDVNLVYSKEQFDKDSNNYRPYGLLIAMMELKLVTLDVEEHYFLNDELDKVSNFNGRDLDNSIYHSFMVNDVVNESLKNGVIDQLIDKLNYL